MSANTNAIPRYELYVLEDGEKWLEITEDTKIPNAATVRINKQDHTIANMVRHALLNNPAVLFSGYKVPHPLHPYFLIKIQTDGTCTPTEALESASAKLIAQTDTLIQKFKREFDFAGASTVGGLGGATSGDVTGGLGGLGGGAYGEANAWSGKDYLDL